jgi:hypothetical protein
MAEMLIVLRRDPTTGKQNIVVKLESDADALPIEHEQLHKKLVEKLIGKGMSVEDLGEIVIEREGRTTPPADEQRPNEPERKAQSEGR